MKTNFFTLVIISLLFFVVTVDAQTTNIPDQNFEQALIDFGIDSDGIINGQVLNSDIENVTTLELSYFDNVSFINDLTGLEGFTNLEELSVNYMEITELDISQNLQLKYLDCSNNNLTSLDVSNNSLLEYLDIGNNGLDVGPFNYFTEIDLSNNPNIKTIYARDMYENLAKINLKNGNNNPEMSLNFRLYPDTTNPDFDPEYNFINVCIEVDDAEAAQNNEPPYNSWDIVNEYAVYSFSDVCSLSREDKVVKNIELYPNPVTDVLYIKNAEENNVVSIIIYDLFGKVVGEYKYISEGINVRNYSNGIYIAKVLGESKTSFHKIIVR